MWALYFPVPSAHHRSDRQLLGWAEAPELPWDWYWVWLAGTSSDCRFSSPELLGDEGLPDLHQAKQRGLDQSPGHSFLRVRDLFPESTCTGLPGYDSPSKISFYRSALNTSCQQVFQQGLVLGPSLRHL